MQKSMTDWQRLESELSARETLRSSLLGWSTEVLVSSGFAPARHHRFLIHELDRITRGEIDRLMVLMPPGSAKSTYTSVLFPAWWFAQHPKTSVLAISHSSSLAENFSRRVRELIGSREGQLGYALSRTERSSCYWRTTQGGEYIATGIRGGITGRRADLVIIDDPIKSQVEADSTSHRDFVWQWYKSDLTTRLKPRARVILIMTRWHEDDLGGQLLRQSPDDWQVVRLPAIAEPDDPLGRAPGEPLWPEWEDQAALERKRDLVGERVWWSLFQQSPRPLAGGLFKTERLSVLDTAPSRDPGNMIVRAWDLAATVALNGNNPDWTVGVKLMRDTQRRFTVLDVVRLRGSPRQVEDAIDATARSDGDSVWIGLPEDPGQAGRSQITYLAGRLAGFRLITSRETGSKATRAMPLASQIEAGNVAVLRCDWTHALLDELRAFPMGRKDDQVDALVRAFDTLLRVGEPAQRVSLPFLAR